MLSNKLFALLAACCVATPLYAADPMPADRNVNTSAKDDVQPSPLKPEHLRGQSIKGAFLGVSTMPPPPALRRQLGLSEGMGLVVEFVGEKSPAEQAGVRQYDVLQKLDDQLLVNTEQLAALVRSHKPGDEVHVTLIRDGAKQTLTAKLAEHDLDPLQSSLPPMPWELDRPNLPRRPPRQGATDKSNEPSSTHSTLTWREGDRNYTVTTRDGHQTVTVTGRDGSSLFEGPIDTQEQQDRLPADIKDKLDKMAKSGLLPGRAEPGILPRGQ